ncbi:DUF943 family protein [Enterobacteriaceae bacterium EKM102V]|uniref:DUF943 family protein n=1 Tax=Pantoea TaxID=53335 RepID=UPI00142E2417|nr:MULTISPECIES: DUF943 family protein [Pantoea]KAF6661479.1 DUF943 family protein [Enterobacteriaceae bacterium EKM102V]KAF6665511.1 DUF943 family protein [Pantoea sp. EKM103V]
MRLKEKIIIALFFLASCVLLSYWLWLSQRPVDIIAVHHRSSGFSDVLVNSFPPTDKGKINWWLKNKEMLNDKYGIPKPDRNGHFYLTIWLFGDGYKELGKYDRLCFDDMKPPVNCIEKERVFSISYSKNRGTIFTGSDSEYRLTADGKILKLEGE